MRLFEYIKLIRPQQWYKNLMIFLPLFFLSELFSLSLAKEVFVGFIALCLISSANYVLNDIIDVERDRAHPEKKSRPLAAKKVTIFEASFIFIIFLIISILIAVSINTVFLVCVLFLFVSTLIYSVWLKKEAVADVVLVAVNFVVRAVAGAFILKVFVSPWLILCPFFLALFLVVGKRDADLKFMKNKAVNHKEVLKYYTPETTNALMIISTTCLIVAYSLYCFSRTSLLFLTLPFAIYAIFRYYYLVNSGSEIARHPEKVYKDWRLMLAGFLWILIIFIIFYFILGKIDFGYILN